MRVRSHQNPFAVCKQFDTIDTRILFAKPDQPLYVEIGFAGGMFLLDFCQKNPQINLVGLEIRKTLVESVKSKISEMQLSNAYVEQANANSAIPQLFQPGCVDTFFIFFPDPWIKKKHLKRRVVNKNLVNSLVTSLKPGGDIFIQSDVQELAEDIRSFFEAEQGLENIFGKNAWAPENYTGSITERESYCLEDNSPVYRLRYRKTKV